MYRNKHNRIKFENYEPEKLGELWKLIVEMYNDLLKSYEPKSNEKVDVHIIPDLFWLDGKKQLCWYIEMIVTEEKRVVVKDDYGKERRIGCSIYEEGLIPLSMVSKHTKRHMQSLLKKAS
jgi:hypothetical protein